MKPALTLIGECAGAQNLRHPQKIVADVILFSSWTDWQFSVSECNYLQ